MGILQARILEWVAIPPPGDLPNPGIELKAPALQAEFFFFFFYSLNQKVPKGPWMPASDAGEFGFNLNSEREFGRLGHQSNLSMSYFTRVHNHHLSEVYGTASPGPLAGCSFPAQPLPLCFGRH